MSAQLLDGRAAADALRKEIAAGVAELVAAGRPAPGLATVLAGDDPASAWYVRSIARAAQNAGMQARDVRVDPAGGDAGMRAALQELNDDPAIHGVIVMLPLPAPLTQAAVTETLDPKKDVDGITPMSAGRLSLGQPGFVPSTPLGGTELLRHHGLSVSGLEATVVGRSNIVGKPLAMLLLNEHATVTVAHTRTRDLAAVCRRADLLCVAVGKPGMITAEMIKPGAIVLDFGTTPGQDGKLRGDVDFAGASQVAAWISPVPNGTDRMTTATLLRQTLQAARTTSD